MNLEILAMLTKKKGKTSMHEWENDDSDILWALYRVYKKIRIIFFHVY